MGNQTNFLMYQTEDEKTTITVRLEDETVWMSQKALAELFQTSIPNINMYIKSILEEGEICEDAVVKDYLITATDGTGLMCPPVPPSIMLRGQGTGPLRHTVYLPQIEDLYSCSGFKKIVISCKKHTRMV